MKQVDKERDNRRYNFLRMWQKRYAHMKARHEGHSTNYSHSHGKGLMSQQEFYDWCKEAENFSAFLLLYYDWAEAHFSLWSTPSIDRIDPEKGYVAGNLQWLAFHVNCEKNNKHPITHETMRMS